MRESFISVLLLVSFSLSCKSKDKQIRATSDHIDSSGIANESINMPPDPKTVSDTLVINYKSAVAYQPDSLAIENRMKGTNEAEFRMGMDDYLYSMHESWEYLESTGLKVIDAKDKRYILFQLSNGTSQLIKLDTLDELWGIYLFDPAKPPLLADISFIEPDFESYFKK